MLKTVHRIHFENSKRMEEIPSSSIDLIVTSPPYPMIEMWDEIFYRQDQKVEDEMNGGNANAAFEKIHKLFDPIWDESYRVLKDGGFACINIGDATRTINGTFALYPNHTRILNYLTNLEFTALPCILWRKQTNAPNKFMGSGTLPSGAYVTLEHEYILILRKGGKRIFNNEKDKAIRRESSIFWEERNNWYSDIWFDIKGTLQSLNNKEDRKRSAAYPFELVYRLINMYSVKGDTILDPFLGTGTTISAAIASNRNCIGYEFDKSFSATISNSIYNIIEASNQYIVDRLNRHLSFLKSNPDRVIKYRNKYYGFPVVTSPEQEILFNKLESINCPTPGVIEVYYSDSYHECFNDSRYDNPQCIDINTKKSIKRNKVTNENQMPLFKRGSI